jgi:hypothetical protein
MMSHSLVATVGVKFGAMLPAMTPRMVPRTRWFTRLLVAL